MGNIHDDICTQRKAQKDERYIDIRFLSSDLQAQGSKAVRRITVTQPETQKTPHKIPDKENNLNCV